MSWNKTPCVVCSGHRKCSGMHACVQTERECAPRDAVSCSGALKTKIQIPENLKVSFCLHNHKNMYQKIKINFHGYKSEFFCCFLIGRFRKCFSSEHVHSYVQNLHPLFMLKYSYATLPPTHWLQVTNGIHHSRKICRLPSKASHYDDLFEAANLNHPLENELKICINHWMMIFKATDRQGTKVSVQDGEYYVHFTRH